LENPSNLFISDLAAQCNPDDSKVVFDVQSYACLFLGSCFQALPDQPAATRTDKAFSISKKALLDIIDSKVGLSRFIDVLKRRLSVDARVISKLPGVLREDPTLVSSYLPTSSFDVFLNAQVDLIKGAIYEFYGATNQLDGTGGIGRADGHPHLAEVVRIQKEEIERLNRELSAAHAAPHLLHHGVPGHVTHAPKVHIEPRNDDLQKVLLQLEADIAVANAKAVQSNEDLNVALTEMKNLEQLKQKVEEERDEAFRELHSYRELAEESEIKSKRLLEIEERIVRSDEELLVMRRNELTHAAEKIELESKLDDFLDKVSFLEKEIYAQKIIFDGVIAEKDQKVTFLEEELQRFYHSGGKLLGDMSLSKLQQENHRLVEELEDRERMIKLLEDDLKEAASNETLQSEAANIKKQVWKLQGELEASRYTAVDAGRKILSALTPVFAEICEPSQLMSYAYNKSEVENDQFSLNPEALAGLILSDISVWHSEMQHKIRDALNLPETQEPLSFSEFLSMVKGSNKKSNEIYMADNQSKHAEYDAQISRLEDELSVSKNQYEECVGQLSFVERELEDMNTRYDISVDQMRDLERQMTDSHDKITSLSTELADVWKNLEDAGTQNRALAAQIGRLESENLSSSSAYQERIATLARELDAANARIADMLEEHSDVRNFNSNDKITSLSAELADVRKNLEDAGTQNRALAAQIGRLESENLSSSSAYQERIATLARELDAANARIADMLEEHSDARNSYAVREGELEATVRCLENEIASLNSKVDSVHYERESEFAEQSMRNIRLSEELTLAKKEIQDLASLVILFEFPSESRSSELKDELDRIVSADGEGIDVPQCMTTIYGIINSYDNFYQNSTRTTTDLRNNVESLTSQLKSTKSDMAARLETAERVLADTSLQLSAMTQQHADIQAQLIAERDRSETLSRRENDYLRERDALLAELGELRMQSEGQTIGLETKLKETYQLLEEARSVVVDKEDVIARLQALNSELSAEVRSLRANIADLNGKLEGADADIRHFQGKIFSHSEPLTQVVTSLRQERDSLRSDLITKETEINELLSERSSLNGRIAGFVVAFEGLQEELQSIRNERDDIEAQLAAKVKLVSSMKSEISNSAIEIKRREEEMARVLEQFKSAKLSMQQNFALQQTHATARMRSV
jgi:chromosome segregation ATPase